MPAQHKLCLAWFKYLGLAFGSRVDGVRPGRVLWPSSVTHGATLRDIAEKVYGPDGQLSPLQVEALSAFFGGQNVAYLTPVGGGKSALFLGAAILAARRGQVCVLLSPMRCVALNAVAAAELSGIAAALYSASTAASLMGELDAVEYSGAGLGAGLLVCTYEDLVRDGTLTSLLCLAARKQKIAAIVYDEALIACLHTVFRGSVFNYVADLSILTGYLPSAVLSASIGPSGVGPVLDFFGLSGASTKVVQDRSSIFKASIELTLTQCSSGLACDARILELLAPLASLEAGRPRRAMVVLPSKSLVEHVLEIYAQQLGGVENFMGVTGDSSTADILAAVESAQLIVSTSILSTATTIANLDLCILGYTTFSLQDVVQTCGRVGRGGQPAKFVFLFCQAYHNQLFGEPGTAKFAESVAAPLRWAGNMSTDKALVSTFTPAGVAELVHRKGCRRRAIMEMLYEGPPSSYKACAEQGAVLCDVCARARDVEEDVQDVEATPWRAQQGAASVPAGISASSSSSSSSSTTGSLGLVRQRLFPASSAASPLCARMDTAEDLPVELGAGSRSLCALEDGWEEDDSFYEQISTLEGLVDNRVEAATGGVNVRQGQARRDARTDRAIFIVKQLQDMQPRSTARCWACGKPGCKVEEGFCGSWPTWVPAQCQGARCAACGGNHIVAKCKSDFLKVPQSLHRCFSCFLSQKEMAGGVRLHLAHDDPRVTPREKAAEKERCKVVRVRQTHLLALLWSSMSLWDEFIKSHGSDVTEPMWLKEQQPKERLASYRAWFWVSSPLGQGLVNLDVLFAYLYKRVPPAAARTVPPAPARSGE